MDIGLQQEMPNNSDSIYSIPATITTPHNRFTALLTGPPGWAAARRELLDFMVQGQINRGRHAIKVRIIYKLLIGTRNSTTPFATICCEIMKEILTYRSTMTRQKSLNFCHNAIPKHEVHIWTDQMQTYTTTIVHVNKQPLKILHAWNYTLLRTLTTQRCCCILYTLYTAGFRTAQTIQPNRTPHKFNGPTMFCRIPTEGHP